MVLFGFSGCGAKEQISYDFDTYLSYNMPYKGFNFYNYDARDDEFENTYNDGYCAFAYHVSTESNTISYIAFESGDLQYMNMKSALSLFPEIESKN